RLHPALHLRTVQVFHPAVVVDDFDAEIIVGDRAYGRGVWRARGRCGCCDEHCDDERNRFHDAPFEPAAGVRVERGADCTRRSLERPRLGPVASFMVRFDPLTALVARIPGMRDHYSAASREHVAEQRVTATREIGVLERDDITLPPAAGTGAALAGVVDLDVYEVASLWVVGEVLGDVERPRIRRGGTLVVPDHDPAIAKRLLAVVRGAHPMRRLCGQKVAGTGPVTEEAAELIQL